jgi:hypothetical protein
MEKKKFTKNLVGKPHKMKVSNFHMDNLGKLGGSDVDCTGLAQDVVCISSAALSGMNTRKVSVTVYILQPPLAKKNVRNVKES